MKVKVEKLSNNKTGYRTPVDDLDYLPQEPKVDYGLMIKSSTHESGGIYTSPLTSVVVTDDGYIIETLNSKYKITKLKDNEKNTHTNNFV
jgi:hypothetical protein